MKAAKKGEISGAIFIDLSSAFDLVCPDILLKKMEIYGFQKCILGWMESYLKNRYQAVWIDHTFSTYLPCQVGVPQGSILGPVLFCIFINDLPSACKNSTPYLFADDGALYFKNITRGDYENMKEELIYVYQWLQANGLALNNSKTKFIVFDSHPHLDALLVPVKRDLTLVICEKKSEKYLGLIVDSKLTFYDHIEYIKKDLAHVMEQYKM